MTDFPNKIVSLIIAFIMFVMAPLTWSYVRNEAKSELLAFNEVTQFIDRVTDKASITQQDLDDLYMGVNATGGTYDIRVKRYIRLSTLDDNGDTRTLYLSDDFDGRMNIGDIVKVTVEEIGISPAKRLLWAMLRLDSGKTEFSLAGTVR